MADMGVSEEFLAQGGTELACMSTTDDRAVAEKFAQVRKSAHPLLLKVQARGFAQCGADISWLSMYPGEKEVLYPPLTYLRPTGPPVKEANGCTVVTVEPIF